MRQDPTWRTTAALRTLNRIVAPAAAFVAATGVAPNAWAQSNNQDSWYGHMGNGWNHMMGWGGGMFGGFGMIIVWGVLIVLVILLVRGFTGGWPSASQPRGAGSTALDILKERYAKGEISKEEYEERRKTLTE